MELSHLFKIPGPNLDSTTFNKALYINHTSRYAHDAGMRYFVCLYGMSPLMLTIPNVDETKILHHLLTTYKYNALILDASVEPSYDETDKDDGTYDPSKKLVYSISLFIYDVVISIRSDRATILCRPGHDIHSVKTIEKWYDELSQFQTTGDNLYMILKEMSGYRLSPFKITIPTSPLELNYNKDFESVHENIYNRLCYDNKGLVLLHGLPGSGKSTYIKYLIGSIKDKKIIFLPNHFSSLLSSPGFIDFLLTHKNSILIVEDAETVIRERTEGETSAVSNILNVSDGILSDILHIQIICTFNCEVERIDKALLRSGRLIEKYHFGKLEKSRAIELAKTLNKNIEIKEDIILADIYNADNLKTETKVEESVGFKVK